MIDTVEVIIYREVYYEHVKPMLKNGCDSKKIDEVITPILEGYGWSVDKFHAFQIIDLAQRLSKLKQVKVMAGNTVINKEQISNFLELRCPLRSEQKD